MTNETALDESPTRKRRRVADRRPTAKTRDALFLLFELYYEKPSSSARARASDLWAGRGRGGAGAAVASGSRYRAPGGGSKGASAQSATSANTRRGYINPSKITNHRRRAMDAPAAALLAIVVQSDAFFPERALRFRRPTILATVSFDPSLLEVSQAFVPVGRLEVLVVVRV